MDPLNSTEVISPVREIVEVRLNHGLDHDCKDLPHFQCLSVACEVVFVLV